MEKEKIEVFGTWVFSHDIDKSGITKGVDLGVIPYGFHVGTMEGAIQSLCENYYIEKMGVITLVEGLFQL